MTIKSEKLFINGSTQVLRLSKEFCFEGKDVYIRKSSDEVILSTKKSSWEDFFNMESYFDDDFLAQRDNDIAQERNINK